VDQYNQALKVAYDGSNRVQTVTDCKSRSLTFTYSGSPARLSSVADSTGRNVQYGYSGPGDLVSVTDPESNISTFAYDTNHQIVAVSNAVPQLVVSNVYDGFGHVSTQYTEGKTEKTWRVFWTGWENVEKDPQGGRRVFYYDDRRRLFCAADALFNLTYSYQDAQDHVFVTFTPRYEPAYFYYDGSHNLTQSVDTLNFTNRSVYDSQNNLVQSIDARGNTNRFGYNSKFQLTGSTNAAGDWTTYGYSATDGLLLGRTNAGGATAFSYDSYGHVSVITYPAGLGSEGFLNSPAGDVLSHTNALQFVTSFAYNARRELTNTIAPTNITTKVIFDANSQVSLATDARGFSRSNTWSPTGKLLATRFPATPQGTPLQTNVYDNRDWLAASIDPLNAVVNFTNDISGRLFSTTDPLSRTTWFAYDENSRRIYTTNAALRVTRQDWSPRNELLQLTDPATNVVSKVYDPAGNQITLTNRNGKRWQFQFDAANRLTNTVTPLYRQTVLAYNSRGLLSTMQQPSGKAVTNFYDARSRLTNSADALGSKLFSLDANNNVINVVELGKSNAWTFDAYDRVSSYKDADGNLIQYRYDLNGNLTNLVYPGNRTVTYAFDTLNRLTNVADWSGGQTAFTYDLASHLKTVVRPNGTMRVINYDAAGQPTNIIEKTTAGGGVAFWNLTWTNTGQISSEFAAPLPHAYTPPSRTLYFDDDNRLTNINGVLVTNDLDGNMTWGPLPNGNPTNYAYDARNRLSAIASLSMGYDPAGNRTTLTNGSVVTSFIVNPNAKLSQALMRIKSGTTNYYIYGLGLLYEITETATATNTLTYHYDYRGSTVALTDSSGNTRERFEYSAYGSSIYRSGTTDTPFLYNGRYGVQTDPNGLLYMRARYYNPYICRFINADPSGFLGGLNSYAYADGNPINLLDPFGLCAIGSGGVPSWLASANSVPNVNYTVYPNANLGPFLQSSGSATPQPYYNPAVATTYSVNYPREDEIMQVVGAGIGMGIQAAKMAPAIALMVLSEGMASPEVIAAESADTIAAGLRISLYRVTGPGESFIRYESANSAFTRITPGGGVTPGTFAAPASDGLVPVANRASVYNLPSAQIPRPNAITLTPPAGTPIIGPRPVAGGSGNEVLFPMGF
jgi:RHS repeat-associated protein